MPFSLPSPFSITVLLTRASLLARAKSLYYTNAWCSISSVSRAACAVMRTRRVATERIGITVMNVVLILINIWKERKKTLIFADRLLWLTNLEKNSIVCIGCFCFGRHFNVLNHIWHNDFPMHDVSFPVCAGLQAQLKDPPVLQKVLASQLWTLVAHSLKEEGIWIFGFSGLAIF